MQPIVDIKELQPIYIYHEPKLVNSSESSDSEENSYDDSSEDYLFDVESMSSSVEEEIVVKKIYPCVIKNVQDCCTYSAELIYLLQDSSITCYNKISYRYITNNRYLKSIVSYNGYLYGIDKNGTLYVLSNDYYEMTYWVWKKVKGAPHNIKHINTTLNCQYLLLQADENYLYNENFEYKKIKIKGKRIYGKNDQCYLDIENNTCHVHVDGDKIKSFKHILNGVMNHDNDIFLINIYDNEHKYVKIIDYKPFYF